MKQHEIHTDVDLLANQLSSLKEEMDKAIRSGKCFIEVKLIHLQIKELSRHVEHLKGKNASAFISTNHRELQGYAIPGTNA